MAIVVAIMLGGLALAFVLYPLYRRRPEELRSDNGRRAAREEDVINTMDTEKEQTARTSLQEVEFDYQLGNISDNDYQELRERYMQRALRALRSRYEREQAIDQEIEEQLRRLKEQEEAHDTPQE
jgi:ribosome-binding ATPase YchF (GTP1/OBG family)